MKERYQNIRVVLVEDNEDDAELALRSLKKNCNVEDELIWLQDGAEALNFLLAEGNFASRNQDFTPELILLDLKLPKISGLEVLKKIKEHPLLKTIPTVILTSSKEINDIRESYRLGANSFVTKPIDYNDFIEATNKVSSYWLSVNQPLD